MDVVKKITWDEQFFAQQGKQFTKFEDQEHQQWVYTRDVVMLRGYRREAYEKSGNAEPQCDDTTLKLCAMYWKSFHDKLYYFDKHVGKIKLSGNRLELVSCEGRGIAYGNAGFWFDSLSKKIINYTILVHNSDHKFPSNDVKVFSAKPRGDWIGIMRSDREFKMDNWKKKPVDNLYYVLNSNGDAFKYEGELKKQSNSFQYRNNAYYSHPLAFKFEDTINMEINTKLGTLTFRINDNPKKYEFMFWFKQDKHIKYKIFMVIEGIGEYAVADYQERDLL